MELLDHYIVVFHDNTALAGVLVKQGPIMLSFFDLDDGHEFHVPLAAVKRLERYLDVVEDDDDGDDDYDDEDPGPTEPTWADDMEDVL